MWPMSEGVMHVRVSYESQSGLYQRTNQIACYWNNMESTLIWRHVRLLYVVQSGKHFMAYYLAILPLPM